MYTLSYIAIYVIQLILLLHKTHIVGYECAKMVITNKLATSTLYSGFNSKNNMTLYTSILTYSECSFSFRRDEFARPIMNEQGNLKCAFYLFITIDNILDNIYIIK